MRLPPIALAVSFIDCINRGDVDGLVQLMSDDHRLEVFNESPVMGREANRKAWDAYMRAFSRYVIHPQRLAEKDDVVAVLGCTTGSHLGLPDDEERKQTLIWIAHVQHGLIARWRLIDDTDANRRAFGLDRSS